MKEEKIYFADTSFLIDFARGRDEAVSIMDSANMVVTGSICIFELGKKAKFDPEDMEQSIVAFSGLDAKKAFDLFRELSAEGKKINEIDYLIGAQAINQDLPILTADKDFGKIPGLETVFYRD